MDNKLQSILELIPNIISSGIIPYEYNTFKSEKYDRLIASYFDGIKAQKNPAMFHMCGIPAAGKTTFYKNHKDEFKGYIFISFDDVMEHIDDYKKDIEKYGSVEAFKKWEMPARIIGYEILRIAIKNKYNIFLDHSGLNDGHKFLLENIKKLGYHTEVRVVQCTPRTALIRSKRRERAINRHLPLQLIINRFLMLSDQIINFGNIADLCSGNTDLVTKDEQVSLIKELIKEILNELINNVRGINITIKELLTCLDKCPTQIAMSNAVNDLKYELSSDAIQILFKKLFAISDKSEYKDFVRKICGCK